MKIAFQILFPINRKLAVGRDPKLENHWFGSNRHKTKITISRQRIIIKKVQSFTNFSRQPYEGLLEKNLSLDRRLE